MSDVPFPVKSALVCLASAVALFAEPMCLSLCGPCAGKSDSTCVRVDSLCSCAALLDSARTADSLRNAYKITAMQKLSAYLLKNCRMKSCSYKVILKDGRAQEIHSAECPLPEKELIADSAVAKDSAAALPPEPEMKPECVDMCSKCLLQKSKEPAADENPAFCAKVDSVCRCSYFAQRKVELAQKADSVAAILASRCDTLANCSLLVTLRGKDLKVIDLRMVPAAAPVTAPAADSSADVAPPVKVISQGTPPVFNDFMDGIFYWGPALGFGLFKQHGYGSLDIEGDQGVHASAGIFLRWYFYRYGSFETGEPIYEWGDVTYYNSLLDYEVTDSANGFFDNAGFEFGHWLGAGLDVHHRVTVEFQYLLGCFKSGEGFDDYGTGMDETWKIKAELSL